MVTKGLALMRALGALILTIAIVFGVPVLLVSIVGNPFPSSVPTIDEIRTLLTQNGDGFAQALTAALAILIWVVWVQLVVALIVEAFAAIRNAEARRLPTAPGIQHMAARLVAAITLATVLAAGPILAPAVGALNVDSAVSTATASLAQGDAYGASVDTEVASAGVDVASHESNSQSADVVTEAGLSIVIASQTELWDLADAAYGDGVSWRLIAQANEGVLDASGAWITSETIAVPPGTQLVLPGVAADVGLTAFGEVLMPPGGTGAVAEATADGFETPIVDVDENDSIRIVEKGDSLWTLAEEELSRRLERTPTEQEVATYWSHVVAANPDVASGDADLIFPGEELVVPGQEISPSLDGTSATATTSALEQSVIEISAEANSAPVDEVALLDHGFDAAPSDTNEAAHSQSTTASAVAPAEELPVPVGAEPVTSESVEIIDDKIIDTVAVDDTAVDDTAVDGTAVDDTAVDGTEQAQGARPDDIVALPTPEPTAPAVWTADGAQAVDAPIMEESPLQVIGLAALGGATLALGISGALRRRRDLQRRTRPAGTFARPPSKEAAIFEAAISHASAELVESQNGLGWRAIPAGAAASLQAGGPVEFHSSETGRLHAIAVFGDADTAGPVDDDETVGPSGETVTNGPSDDADTVGPMGDADPGATSTAALSPFGDRVDTAGPAPQRFDLLDPESVKTAEQLWSSADDEITVEIVEPGTAIVPTTVIVGTDAETGELVLLDLASAGALELIGDEAEVNRFARSVVLDLAVSDRADDLCVIAIDIAAEIADLERVSRAESFADALDEAVKCGHARGDSNTPVVVISANAPDETDNSPQALREMGAVVVAPGLPAAATISITGDHATILPSGTEVLLTALADDDYKCVADLVDTTSSSALEPIDESASIDLRREPDADVGEFPAGPIEVKVLGPVEITGAESFSSLKAVDVIAYLAFHRAGANADQIKTWVWPTFDPPTDKAFANVMSRARSGLGSDPDGEPFLSRAGANKTYQLSDVVTTDFDRLCSIVALADVEESAVRKLQLFKQALELIRGVPFSGGSASSFLWADNHARPQVEFTIDEAVHRCADLALETGDLAAARWAALKGLELVPGCEQCFRRRFLAASASGDRSELRRAMADLERSAALELGEPEAVDYISGELLELYQELDQALASVPS